jgi:lysozyme family protein
MSHRFERAFALLAVHEGGYVNHPADPGGATNKGVTQRTYNAFRRTRGLPRVSVRLIKDHEVCAIYQRQYWDAVRAEDLPEGLGYCLFDAAVNSGPARAAKWLQALVGADVDGVVGVQTLARVGACDPVRLIDDYCDRRLAFMRSLRHWPTFKNGWTRRVGEVRAQSKRWAIGRDAAVSVVAPQAKTGEPEAGLIARVLAALLKLFTGE